MLYLVVYDTKPEFEITINRLFTLTFLKIPLLYETNGHPALFFTSCNSLTSLGSQIMSRLHKKKNSLCLFDSYLNNEVTDGRQCAEFLHARVVSLAIPRRMINNNFEHPIMDTHNKDVINVQVPDCDYEFSEDEITLCTVTMLGVVMQWQPRVANIKEVCLKTTNDYSISTAIYDNCTTNDRYSYSLLSIWANQLRANGFWADDKKNLRVNLLRLEGNKSLRG
jgi:hypothetical protein